MPWQAQRRLMQAVTNSFPCGAHLHRMGLRGTSGCTLCQRARKQRVDDQHDGCGRIDPETLGHIQSARCVLQAREATSVHHHCWQQVQREITVASPESKGWTWSSVISCVWASVRVVRRYNSRHVFFQKVCIDCSPTSVKKVHPFDSGDVTDVSH